MGRYYTNTTGTINGKFAFGTQASNVPETWGMQEQDIQTITYYADEDTLPELLEAQKHLNSKITQEQYNKITELLDGNVYNDDILMKLLNVDKETMLVIQSAYFDLLILNQVIEEVQEEGYSELECEL